MNYYLTFILVVILSGCGAKSKVSDYELVSGWPALSDSVMGKPSGISLDQEGNLWVVHRGVAPLEEERVVEDAIIKLDAETGELLDSWGSHFFLIPHGLSVDPDGNLWITDVGLHQIFKFDQQGNLLLTLGERLIPGEDSLHFNKPTDVAVTAEGSFYVSDGYGNSRIVKFSREGKYIMEWGSKGSEQGEFDLPHSIVLDQDENVLVADRENGRLQQFDAAGKFKSEWRPFHPNAKIYAVGISETNLIAVDYLVDDDQNPLGSDITILDKSGTLEIQVGRSGNYTGPTARYHDVIMNLEGVIYTADILNDRLWKFKRLTK